MPTSIQSHRQDEAIRYYHSGIAANHCLGTRLWPRRTRRDIGGTFNGDTATVGQFPQQVSLHGGLLRQHFCSGTILNERWILTAAHCSFLVNLLLGTWALVGTNNLSQGGQFYSIESIVSHPGFVRGTFINDIALWRTSDDIVFSVAVQPAILPTTDTLGNVALTVSGWGPNNVIYRSIR